MPVTGSSYSCRVRRMAAPIVAPTYRILTGNGPGIPGFRNNGVAILRACKLSLIKPRRQAIANSPRCGELCVAVGSTFDSDRAAVRVKSQRFVEARLAFWLHS